MEPLRLKPRQPVEADIENWDDDDFVVETDDLSFRSPSTSTNIPSRPTSSRRRDSGSSHFSFRSEAEGEEETHVHIPGDDEKSTLDAIAAAQNAGIPLPTNVPSSALMGGTIKRLGGRKIRKIVHDDWENDLEIPDSSQGLKIKRPEQPKSPDTSRHVSFGSTSTHTSPINWGNSPPTSPFDQDTRRESGHSIQAFQSMQSIQSATSNLSAAINLDRFKDGDDDDDFFDGGDTIRASKTHQLPKPVSFITPPTPQRDVKPAKAASTDDDFETDLELPSDGKLKLSMRKEIPKTPANQSDDLDWGEGSLGTRWGGTRRDTRSARNSAASALSPSISSSITAESEDETFDGLVLPPGPVNWTERLQQRRKSKSPNRISEEPIVPPKKVPAEADKPDFLDGLDIGEGDVFDSSKLTLHKNVKVKETRPASPARPKTALSLTFTNKPVNSTRIPRLNHHERTHSTSLEPVSESGGPIPQRTRRSHSRMGHSAQSSIASMPTPTTTSPSRGMPPPPPRRREVGTRTSTNSLRNEPTTTSAQLLKQKRSMPAIRASNTPARQSAYRHDRPPPRSESNRPSSGIRPKTPTERQRQGSMDSPATVRKTHLPFLPAGASQSQSQHVATKRSGFRRHDSDTSIGSIDLRPSSRTISRSTMRSPSPNHRHRATADTWERLSKPKNKKNFGDGHELDGFDDLPTSRETETRYLKQPTSSGPKVAMRNKLYQNVLPDRNLVNSPSHPAPRPSFTPHFARDTAASRIARETALAQRVPSNGPLTPLNSQRTTHLSSRSNLTPTIPHHSNIRSRKHKRPQQTKPHLISNLNSGKESKMVNGMFYNANTYRWEGNENALNVFEPPVQTPTQAVASTTTREKDSATPRPALITNISATKGVQVVGGMVFDPQNMCWLKLDNPAQPSSETSDTMDGFDALDDDDEDVFKDIPDLEDNTVDDEGVQGRTSDIKDEWLVGEEFDVGPEFIRRQREEEDRWRRKCEKWIGRGSRDREAWRWTIRELVSQFADLAM
ncbi:hypothetical protein SNK05_012376 [Fusarium graminearum]|uniref:Chromosome 3, complete genome n=1 Tax=Gibberella zeae (strain ATCC MYA-4620 / CBS 123657 / FGSC 9075 / NRRL 31084 / PH-1) TaxID=229533 RepID=A0A1C3YKD5_GIBZE|nr:hypothetical protein FGRA07_05970 [Fusarium graminearum]SCB64892.1 unnamed protein product [Fusarium graminearum]